MKNTNKKRL